MLAKRVRSGLVVLVLFGAGVCGSASAATSHNLVGSAASASAKTCSSSYVHAYLSWGEKCLRAGESCKVGNRQYRPYGFSCPPNGHLRRL
jgi:hypothetical protein